MILIQKKIIYRNGVKIDITPKYSTGDLSVSNVLSICKLNLTSNCFNGNMDDRRNFTAEVLSQEEITRIYNGNQLNTTEPVIGMDLSPIIWYKFEDSSNVVLDSMGIVNLVQDGLNFSMTYDGVGALKGNGSLKGTAETTLVLTYDYSHFVDAITIVFWIK
jgi:hypothetical protein